MKKFEFEEKNLFCVCPFVTTQQLLLGKWLIPILNELGQGTKRFNEMRKTFGITQTTLSQQLKILEREGFIRREIGKRIKIRFTPEISFALDTSLDYSEHIQKILLDIEKEGTDKNENNIK